MWGMTYEKSLEMFSADPEKERRRRAVRELLKTPAGILWVEAELKRVHAEFRAAYSPTGELP